MRVVYNISILNQELLTKSKINDKKESRSNYGIKRNNFVNGMMRQQQNHQISRFIGEQY